MYLATQGHGNRTVNEKLIVTGDELPLFLLLAIIQCVNYVHIKNYIKDFDKIRDDDNKLRGTDKF